MSLTDNLRAIDRYQQRRARLSFLVALVKKSGEDQAGQHAALIAYYGFFSLFPMLLVLVSVLGFVLQGDAHAQQSILKSALSHYPILGNQLQQNVHSLKGSVPALAIGLVGSLLGSLGLTSAAQNAFNNVWYVPHRHRPDFFSTRLRGVKLILLLGVLVVISTAAAGFVTAGSHGALALLIATVLALLTNLLLFFTAFRLLTCRQVRTRELYPGVLVGAVLWQILQHIGGYYVDHVVRRAGETSALFALVLGLLTWLYLGGQVTMFAAELNVVLARRLWPRSLLPEAPVDADRRALVASAEAAERIDDERVQVSFGHAEGEPHGAIADAAGSSGEEDS